jgi:hypothetical protein
MLPTTSYGIRRREVHSIGFQTIVPIQERIAHAHSLQQQWMHHVNCSEMISPIPSFGAEAIPLIRESSSKEALKLVTMVCICLPEHQ